MSGASQQERRKRKRSPLLPPNNPEDPESDEEDSGPDLEIVLDEEPSSGASGQEFLELGNPPKSACIPSSSAQILSEFHGMRRISPVPPLQKLKKNRIDSPRQDSDSDIEFLEEIPADPETSNRASPVKTNKTGCVEAPKSTESSPTSKTFEDCQPTAPTSLQLAAIAQPVSLPNEYLDPEKSKSSAAKSTGSQSLSEHDDDVIFEKIRAHICPLDAALDMNAKPCCWYATMKASESEKRAAEVESPTERNKEDVPGVSSLYNGEGNIFSAFGIVGKTECIIPTSQCNDQDVEAMLKDLSLGQEKRAIPVINEVDNHRLPPEFQYVPGLVPGPHLSLLNEDNADEAREGCDCEEPCSSGCLCVWEQDTFLRGKCAYKKDGTLIAEIAGNKHLPVIMECNSKCKCDRGCQNRVCQKGIRFSLQVFKTEETGWGVRAGEAIPKRSFVVEYAGEMLQGGSEVQIRSESKGDEYLFEMDPLHGHSVDAKFKGNVARFVNHSCRPNLQSISVKWGGEKHGVNRVAFFSTKDIKKGEQLTLDYTERYWYPKGEEGLFCKCGTRNCNYSEERFPKFKEEYKKRQKKAEKREQEYEQRQLEHAMMLSIADLGEHDQD